jgi:hypothetical protein
MGKVQESTMIEITRIHKNEWNPNVQDEITFNNLLEEIKAEGFGHPIDVVACDCDKIEGSHFKIVGGEHRWRAAGILEYTEIPCFIQEYEEDEEKFKIVRKNQLSGEIDPAKMTKLVQSLEPRHAFQEIAEKMAFQDEKALKAVLQQEKKAKVSASELEKFSSDKRELRAVELVTDIVRTIFVEAGDTVDQSYLLFGLKGKLHLAVQLDDENFKLFEKLAIELKSEGMDINVFLSEAVNRTMASFFGD